MEIGKKIKEKRIEAGYTQKELAEILHVSRQTISSWEVGRTFPDLTTLVTLSELYDMPLDDLVKEDSRLVEDITHKVTRSERRKIVNIVLSFLLVTTTASLVFFAYQYYQDSQVNDYGLHSNDLIDTAWEVLHDPTRTINQAFLSFDSESAVILNQYGPWPSVPESTDESDEDDKEPLDNQETEGELLAKGLEEGMNHYENLDIDVYGQQYIINADGLLMEFTRLSSTIIRSSDGIEYYKVLDESVHDSLFSIADSMYNQ